MKKRTTKYIYELNNKWAKTDRFGVSCLVLQTILGLLTVSLAYGMIK